MTFTTVDELISHTRGMTKRSELLQSINEDLCLEMDQLQLHVIHKEDAIEELHTRLENTNIFLRHLTSLELRCDFLEKQIAHLEGEDTLLKDSEILATRNLGLHEFRMRKENNINRKTVETTLENLAREYDYLTEQLQEANQACVSKEDEDEGRTNVSCADDTLTEISNDTSIFSTMNDSNTSSSLLDITNNRSGNYNEQASVKQWPQHQNQTKARKKRHLLKMESFLTIPYEQKIVQNKPREVEKPYLKHFRISSLQTGGSSETDGNSRVISTSTTASEASFPPRNSGKWHLPLLNLTTEDPEMDTTDGGLTEEFQSMVADDSSSFTASACSSIPRYHHRRHLSMPDTTEISESFFSDAERCTEGTFTEVSTGNIQGYIHQPNGGKTADSERLDFKWLLRKKRDQDGEFPGSSKGVLRHFVSQDTGLSLIHRGKRVGKCGVTAFARPTEFIHDEESYEEGYVSDDSYGEGVAKPLVLESVEEEAEGLYYEEAGENEKKADKHIGARNLVGSPQIKFGDDTGIMIPCKAVATIRKSRSHESIFDTYRREEEERKLEMQSLDLKSQTLKWLKPCTPVVSSTREIAYGKGKIFPLSSGELYHSRKPEEVGRGSVKCIATKPRVAEILSSSQAIPTYSGKASDKNIISTMKKATPIAISLPSRPPARKLGSTLTADCLTSASTKRSRWWQSMIPNSAIVTAETGRLINIHASRSVATNCSGSYQNSRFTSPFLRPQTSNMNGSFSTMVIGHNGSRMISHGFGSDFNSSVVSSEVNQDALQDALEGDIEEKRREVK